MGRQKNLQNISFCHPFGVYSLVRPYTGVTLRFTPACVLTSLWDYASPLMLKNYPKSIVKGRTSISIPFLPDTNNFNYHIEVTT